MEHADDYSLSKESKTAPNVEIGELLEVHISEIDITELNSHDEVLSKKMYLVNNALDEIGFTGYHWKMFFLNGMGYAVDSLIGQIQGTVLPQVQDQFKIYFPGSTIAVYVGLLFGALLWGFSADLIGRRLAFNTSLLLCGSFAIISGAMPNYASYSVLVALTSAAEGGNLVLDTTIFLEFLPYKKQWMLSLMALWWGVGQAVAVLIGWPLIVNFSCPSADNCTHSNNMGWRYTWFANGGLVLMCGVLRVTVIRLLETPKYNLVNGRDEQVVKDLQQIARDSGRTCSLTLEDLKACGEISSNDVGKGNVAWYQRIIHHLKMLFPSKKVGISTVTVFFSWAAIGLIYPLYSVFLPFLLQSRGTVVGDGSMNTTYKNDAISNVASIGGPILGAGVILLPKMGIIPKPGRRGAMAVGALLTMVFLFAYTDVKTPSQVLGLSCAIFIFLDMYYGVLYAYTPEVFPSASRATGNAASVACNRIMGIIAPLVAYYGNTATAIPIYIMAALFGCLTIVSLLFPFEPTGRRSV